MTTAPAATAAGANSLLMLPPAEKNAICTPLKLSLVSSSTMYVLPRKSIFFPALRAAGQQLQVLDRELPLRQHGQKFLPHRAGAPPRSQHSQTSHCSTKREEFYATDGKRRMNTDKSEIPLNIL